MVTAEEWSWPLDCGTHWPPLASHHSVDPRLLTGGLVVVIVPAGEEVVSSFLSDSADSESNQGVSSRVRCLRRSSNGQYLLCGGSWVSWKDAWSEMKAEGSLFLCNDNNNHKVDFHIVVIHPFTR